MIEFVGYLILFIVGIFLLWKASDVLVDGTRNLAVNIGISSLIIALTVVAFGGSLPELVVSALASMEKHQGIALGNILGSCVANLLLVLGVSALIKPLRVERRVVRREAPGMLIATVILVLAAWGDLLSRIEGSIFLICFGIYLVSFVFVRGKRSKSEKDANKPIKNLVYVALGLIGVIIGARLLITSAVYLAEFFGVTEFVIALSVVAVGTSLPELSVSAVASWKEVSSISIGNVIGSNIFNILLVLGVCALILPIPIGPASMLTLLFLLLITGASVVFFYTGYTLSRKEAVVLLIAYAGYLAYIFW